MKKLLLLFLSIAATGLANAATLVGIDNTTLYITTSQVNSVGGTRFIHLPFVASASGTANTLYLYITTSAGHFPNIKMGIYDNSNNQLGITSSVLVSGSPGWVSAALVSGVTIVSGTTYKLGWIADTGYTGYPGIAATSTYRDASGTYASPPATITSTLDGGINNFAMYADGTLSGSGGLLRRRRSN